MTGGGEHAGFRFVAALLTLLLNDIHLVFMVCGHEIILHLFVQKRVVIVLLWEIDCVSCFFLF